MHLPTRNQAYFFLLATVIIWGISAVIIKLTLPYVSPFAFLFWRFVINLILITPAYLIYRTKYQPQRHRLRPHYQLKLLALGAMYGLMLGLVFVGFNHTTAIEGTLLSSLSPIFVVIGGALFLYETVTKRENLALLIALLGVSVTLAQPFISAQVQPLTHLLGNMLLLSFSVIYAVWFLLSKHYLNDNASIMDILFYQIIGAFFILLPAAICEQAQLTYGLTWLNRPQLLISAYHQLLYLPAQLPFLANLGILYMAILATIVANWLNYQGLNRIEASEATVFTYLQPLVAAPIAFIILKEVPTYSFLLGALLIFAGIYLLEKR